MTVVVRRASVEEIMPLRQAVLRPGRPVADSVYAQDVIAVHIGAWDDGALVGCATVFADPWVGSDAVPEEPAAWRLRGVAVDADRQRGGVGRLVLAAAVEAVAHDSAAPLIWANARTASLGFYEKLGWRVAGPEFITPDSGLPHHPITLTIADFPP